MKNKKGTDPVAEEKYDVGNGIQIRFAGYKYWRGDRLIPVCTFSYKGLTTKIDNPQTEFAAFVYSKRIGATEEQVQVALDFLKALKNLSQ